MIELGKAYKVAARNRLATQIDRPWPIPARETIGSAPAVADGKRLYIRGRGHLYCIEKEERTDPRPGR